MLKISCQCDDENADPVDLYVRGLSFECGIEPEDDLMISPLLTEPYRHDGVIVAGGTQVFLTHAPTLMPLNGGVRINVGQLGAGEMTLWLLADGQRMTDTIITIVNDAPGVIGKSVLIPKNVLKPIWQVIQAGIRLDVEVVSISDPMGGPSFAGLQVVFLPKAQPEPA